MLQTAIMQEHMASDSFHTTVQPLLRKQTHLNGTIGSYKLILEVRGPQA